MAQDYVSKVRALLDRAEHPETPQAERELCQSRAMNMMTRHQITEAMVGNSREVPDEIGQITITHTGIFAQVERELTMAIARALGCKSVMYDNLYRKPKSYTAEITGWKSDLASVEVLVASLQMQCKTGRAAWEKEMKKTFWSDLPGFEKFKDRRQFMSGFTAGVSSRLQKAFESAVKEAAAERAEESHGSETKAEAFVGVTVALRDRRESVKDWYDNHYGHSLRTVRSQRAAGGWGAGTAGVQAGSRADIGQHRVGGGRRAIGR